MKKINMNAVFFLAVFCVLIAGPGRADDSGNRDSSDALDYGLGVMDEFNQYRKTVHDEFTVYKNIVNEEFTRYRQKITRFWQDGQMSGKKRWVEYSPDLKTRKIVDFEKGTIEIQVIYKKTEPRPDRKLNHELRDLVTETTRTAFERDEVSLKIEERLVAAVSDVKRTDSIDEAPLVTDIVTGTPIPSDAQIDQAVKTMAEEGVISESVAMADDESVVSIVINLSDEKLKKKAVQYLESVRKYSEKQDLDPALVFAIMHTESSFNPLAKSYVPAYGLMQIVPRTAGKDATNYIYGKPKLLAPSFLYDCENNIMVGTAYIKVLTSRYLRKIKDPQSRTYCAIAAYNTGTANVALAFVDQAFMSKAAPVINTMTPDAVYQALLEKLPQKETRNYLVRVTDRMKHYGY